MRVLRVHVNLWAHMEDAREMMRVRRHLEADLHNKGAQLRTRKPPPTHPLWLSAWPWSLTWKNKTLQNSWLLTCKTKSYKQKIQVLKLGASFARSWIEDTFVMKSCGFVNTVGQGQFVLIFFDEVCKLFGASSSWLATCTFCPSARGLHWRFGEVEVETEVDTSATQNEYGNWVSIHCLGVAYIGFIWL